MYTLFLIISLIIFFYFYKCNDCNIEPFQEPLTFTTNFKLETNKVKLSNERPITKSDIGTVISIDEVMLFINDLDFKIIEREGIETKYSAVLHFTYEDNHYVSNVIYSGNDHENHNQSFETFDYEYTKYILYITELVIKNGEWDSIKIRLLKYNPSYRLERERNRIFYAGKHKYPNIKLDERRNNLFYVSDMIYPFNLGRTKLDLGERQEDESDHIYMKNNRAPPIRGILRYGEL